MTQGGYPGIGRATADLVEALLPRAGGHQLRLIYQADRAVPASLRAACRAPHDLLPVTSRLRSPGDQVELPLRLRQARVDLYHATYYAMPMAPGCPFVLNVFDLIPERYPQYWGRLQSAIIRRWLRRSSRNAAAIFAPSQATARDLERRYAVPASRIVLAPLATNSRRSGGDPDARHAVPRPYLLCVCTNKPHKNLPRLVRGYGIARERYGTVPDLVIAGGWDPRYPEVRRCARTLGLDDPSVAQARGTVRFIHDPPDADLRALYRDALGFVFPSEYEGFGLPILEAMAARVPVAASTTAAVREVAGDAALGFDPLEPEAIAAALFRLGRDAALRAHLIEAGTARVAQFSWQRTAGVTARTYDRVLRGHCPSARG